MGFFNHTWVTVNLKGKSLPYQGEIYIDYDFSICGGFTVSSDCILKVECNDGIVVITFVGLGKVAVRGACIDAHMVDAVNNNIWFEDPNVFSGDFDSLSEYRLNLCVSSLCKGGSQTHILFDKVIKDAFGEEFSLEEVKIAISDLKQSSWMLNMNQGDGNDSYFNYEANDLLRLKTLREAERLLNSGEGECLRDDIKWLRAQVARQAKCHPDEASIACWDLSRSPTRHQYVWFNNGLKKFGKDDSEELCLAIDKGVEEVLIKGRFSVKENPKYRKVIFCDDCWAEVDKIEDLDDCTALMSPGVIEVYNSKVGEADRLVFQPGHPQKGCTYIQHPFRKNTYYEVNSFHDSLRERKQAELLRILESVGAYSATVEVFHEHSEESDISSENEYGVNASALKVEADISGSENSQQGERMMASQRSKISWTFNPPEKPELPGDLCFYPTEETWQQLVKSVMRGGLKTAVVDLEYRREYGITINHLSKLAHNLKTVFGSYDMNLSSKFEQKLHQLTTTVWHYDVIFENENGKRASSSGGTTSAISDGGSENRGEALFMKRVRRYVANCGDINAEQRADLEQLAVKCGIDELRMEELIESAFE